MFFNTLRETHPAMYDQTTVATSVVESLGSGVPSSVYSGTCKTLEEKLKAQSAARVKLENKIAAMRS